MGPVKFDDIDKTAKSLLNDDFQVSGYQFKAKSKCGAANTATVTVDVLTEGAEKVKTPTKISLKLPDFMGVKGITVEKLEIDKGGARKLEADITKTLHTIDGATVSVKSDLSNLESTVAGVKYTGIADTQIQFETKILKPADFNFELTRSFGAATVGVKAGAKNATKPDFGVRYQQGPLFFSLLGKDQFTAFHLHAHHKVNDKIEAAAVYQVGGKEPGSGSVGVQYKYAKDTSIKAKFGINGDMRVGLKHKFDNGFTVLAGVAQEKGKRTTGLQVSVE